MLFDKFMSLPVWNTAEPSGGGGAPAPSGGDSGGSTSSVAPATPASGGMSDADGIDNQNAEIDIFEGMGDLDLDDPPVRSTSPPVTTQNPPPATPAAPTAAQPPATQAAPAAKADPAQAPVNDGAQAQPSPSAQPPAAPAERTDSSGPPTLEGALELIQKPEAIVAFAEDFFKLDEATMEELNTDAAKALPKLLARTFAIAHASALSAMQQFVPNLIDARTAGYRAAEGAQTQFFDAFPALKDPQFKDDILAAIAIARQRNPNQKRTDVIQFVGKMVSAMHGVPMPGAPAAAAPRGPAPPPPYVPHVGGNGGAIPTQLAVGDETGFEGMGRDFDI